MHCIKRSGRPRVTHRFTLNELVLNSYLRFCVDRFLAAIFAKRLNELVDPSGEPLAPKNKHLA